MKIVITESQYNSLTERLDYSVGDIPAKGNTLSPRHDEFIGDTKDYNRKLNRSDISDDEMKINKVRSKLIAMYDNYIDKIEHLKNTLFDDRWEKRDSSDKLKQIDQYESNLDRIREVMKDEQTLLSLYDKFGSQEEHTPRKPTDKRQDSESVKKYVDSETMKNNHELRKKINDHRTQLHRKEGELDYLEGAIERQKERYKTLLQLKPGAFEHFKTTKEEEKQHIKDFKVKITSLENEIQSINQQIEILTSQMSNPT